MNNNFFTAFLMGGLGNQMFQISHAYCQGLKHNVKTIFAPNSFTPNQGYNATKYLTNIFRNFDFSGIYQITTRSLEKDWNNSNPDFDTNSCVEFYGYYQGSHNFLGYNEEIKKMFSPTDEFIEKIKLLYPEVFSKNSVSVHVRRGDYFRFSDVHSMVDISYIEHCLNKIETKGKVYIFSDDKEWVRKNLNGENYIIVENLEDYEELWMISLCQHNIMSCSTFSWWGSFLNQRENKSTYVPSLWFGPNGPKQYNNIFEKNWNIIDVINRNGILYYEQN